MSERPPATVRVLHVDDSPDVAETTAEFLTREADRLAVETATSAGEGLERLAAGEFDCVVSDYDMPGQNGIEFLEAVRERDPDLPFILYTGKGNEEVASDAISAGVTDYLQKGSGTGQYAVLANRIENAVDQYRAERDAAESQQRLREVAESTTDCLWMFDADWEELLFVSGYESVWDRPTEQLREDPRDFLEGVHPAHRESVERAMAQLSDGESIDVEFRLLDGADDPTWVWVKGHPIVDDEGAVVRVVGFTRDVTERKERERQLAAIIENADTAIYVKNRAGEYQLANEALADVFGMDVDEILGKHVSEVFDGESADRSRSADRRVMESGEPETEEVVRTVDGERRVFLSNKFPYRDADGAIVGVIGLSRDITDRKERERALERQNERLEEFASIVSHDLRNPLSVADGHLELAAADCDSDHLDRAANALDRIGALVDDLLTLAREGEQVSEVGPVALGELVAKCWQTVETDGATLANEAEATVLADPSRLQQLLENLVRNAVEHGSASSPPQQTNGEGDRGDVRVTIGTLDGGAGFYVADDGPGIPESDRDRVFESGFSTSAEGTGFGLAIVREIAEAHGWTVTVTDSDDGGARFEITGVQSAPAQEQ
ncbi:MULTISPECIES: PAS domain-containing protein [Salinibaculum]|uniref:hybrid sensor histidine kinase/response regulator n=1 Tax=Salinibaculum TaxID=2732368 RepID=UPI0030D5E999